MIDPITLSSDQRTGTSAIMWANYYMSEPDLPNISWPFLKTLSKPPFGC